MTNKELLELAAKAIGKKLIWHKDLQPYCCLDDVIDNGEWTPLTDDGDALRLAVKLHIDVLHRFVGGQRVEALAPGGPVKVEYCDEKTREAATRRAITRAAAEIGKAQSTQEKQT